MNKPKVDMGYSQRVINKCARDAPKGLCEYCAAFKEECAEHQKYIKDGGDDYES
jgi:hypothetical protein